MSPNVEVSNRGTYVLVRPGGPTEWNYIVGLLSKAVETASANNLRNYLIDVRGIENGLNIVDQYKIAYDEGQKLGFASDSRVALLVDEGDRSRDFVEVAVRNAGYLCEVFNNESDAVEWFDQ